MVGLGSAIISSEINRLYNKDDVNEFWVKTLQYISFGATLTTSKNFNLNLKFF
jgi:hypothetical protein